MIADTPAKIKTCPSCGARCQMADKTTTDALCWNCGDAFRWRVCGCARRLTTTTDPSATP